MVTGLKQPMIILNQSVVLIKNNLGFFVNWKSKQDKKAKKTIGFKEVSILF